jgi:DNA-binding response OmpR family regulator
MPFACWVSPASPDRKKATVETSKENPLVLLLVEDDPAMRSLLCDELYDMGLRLVEADNGEEALRYVMDHKPDLILTDLKMPAGGLDYVASLRQFAADAPIILMTAFGDSKTKEAAQSLGISAYFDKPVRIGELKSAIRRLLDHNGRPPQA